MTQRKKITDLSIDDLVDNLSEDISTNKVSNSNGLTNSNNKPKSEFVVGIHMDTKPLHTYADSMQEVVDTMKGKGKTTRQQKIANIYKQLIEVLSEDEDGNPDPEEAKSAQASAASVLNMFQALSKGIKSTDSMSFSVGLKSDNKPNKEFRSLLCDVDSDSDVD